MHERSRCNARLTGLGTAGLAILSTTHLTVLQGIQTIYLTTATLVVTPGDFPAGSIAQQVGGGGQVVGELLMCRSHQTLTTLQLVVEIRITIGDGSRSVSIVVPLVVQSTPDMSEW